MNHCSTRPLGVTGVRYGAILSGVAQRQSCTGLVELTLSALRLSDEYKVNCDATMEITEMLERVVICLRCSRV